jgi:23S rRNA (adenine2503-C2)-methyltransferase
LNFNPQQINKKNIIGFTEDDLNEYFISIGEKSYRTKQVLTWIHKRNVHIINERSDISFQLREKLNEDFYIKIPQPQSKFSSKDGTIKFLFNVGHNQVIESVFIPEETRNTLCISSQVGCAMDCSFCATGRQGFSRNLTSDEIIGQLMAVSKEIGLSEAITNVVFMGMGEPLTNMHSVVKATSIMMSDLMYGISRRKITISTSGVVPNIYKLSQLTNASLAISLHSADNKIRDQLVPINKSYNIQLLTDACWAYAEATNARYITFEYVMLNGVNDSIEDAESLARLLKHKPAKVNLIPFNSFKNNPYECSDRPTIELFCKLLQSRGIFTTIRKTRGSDIDAACGQLAGKVNDKIKHPLSKRLQ